MSDQSNIPDPLARTPWNIEAVRSGETGVLADGAREFFEEGRLSGTFDARCFAESWDDVIERGVGFILKASAYDHQFHVWRTAGAIGGFVVRDFNTGDPTATEMFWFVRRAWRKGRLGMALLNAFEDEAKRRGAKRVFMVHLAGLNDETMDRLFHIKGYRMIEKMFEKGLT